MTPQAHAKANRSEINGWLWQARHAIRKNRPARAYEAMLSAIWLMGVRA